MEKKRKKKKQPDTRSNADVLTHMRRRIKTVWYLAGEGLTHMHAQLEQV